jgi:hypothetical protein
MPPEFHFYVAHPSCAPTQNKVDPLDSVALLIFSSKPVEGGRAYCNGMLLAAQLRSPALFSPDLFHLRFRWQIHFLFQRNH